MLFPSTYKLIYPIRTGNGGWNPTPLRLFASQLKKNFRRPIPEPFCCGCSYEMFFQNTKPHMQCWVLKYDKKGAWSSFLKKILTNIKNIRFGFEMFERSIIRPFSVLAPSNLTKKTNNLMVFAYLHIEYSTYILPYFCIFIISMGKFRHFLPMEPQQSSQIFL